MTKKLLLADDSVTIQKVIGIIFATEDYELHICDDGDQAFAKALQEYPDLVIADVSMPGKDGFELCQAIKAENGLAHTSVLLLPGTFDHFDESRAQEVGADGWISKPFESQALLEKVAQLLEAEPARPAAGKEAEAPVADTVAEEPASAESPAEETAVDEVVLGLDEVEKLAGSDQATAVEEESADDIWDAVSFEEEDLQSADELAAAAGETIEEPLAEVSDAPLVEDVESELVDESDGADFVFGDDEEPVELTDTVEEEAVAEAEQPLELEEEAVVTDEEEFEPVAEEEEEILELVDEVADESGFVTDEPADEMPVVEPLDETELDEEEEVLDLGEDDILEEEPVEEIVESQPVVESPVELEPETAEEEFVVADEPAVIEEPAATEEPVAEFVAEPVEGVEEEMVAEPVAEFEPDVTDEVEEPAEEGFYDDSTEGVEESDTEDDSLAAPGAAAAAGVAAADAVSPAEQAEQQLRELSEEELKEVVAKIAGPTIEKLANEMLEQIVWEVVPDLAESMIREEIRKIRQGAGD